MCDSYSCGLCQILWDGLPWQKHLIKMSCRADYYYYFFCMMMFWGTQHRWKLTALLLEHTAGLTLGWGGEGAGFITGAPSWSQSGDEYAERGGGMRSRADSAERRSVHCDLTLCVASLRRMIGFTHFSLCFSKITRMLRACVTAEPHGRATPPSLDAHRPLPRRREKHIKARNFLLTSYEFKSSGPNSRFSTCWLKTRRPAAADFPLGHNRNAVKTR